MHLTCLTFIDHGNTETSQTKQLLVPEQTPIHIFMLHISAWLLNGFIANSAALHMLLSKKPNSKFKDYT